VVIPVSAERDVDDISSSPLKRKTKDEWRDTSYLAKRLTHAHKEVSFFQECALDLTSALGEVLLPTHLAAGKAADLNAPLFEL
jgi:hypothetical protein